MEKKKESIIRFDWAAKRILRDKANFDVLEGFMSVLLGKKVKIIEVLESEGNQDQGDSKFNRVDIMAKNDQGELISIEIQLNREIHFLERMVFGTGKAITDHMHRGERYEKVKKVYSIGILYFKFGNGDDYIYHGQTQLLGIHTGRPLELSDTDKECLSVRLPEDVFPEYYVLCVGDFNKKAITPMEEWMEYLKSGKVDSNTKTPGLKEASEKLSYLQMSEAERHAYERYLDNLIYEQGCIDSARLEGKAEGRAEEKLEMARNLKKLGIQIEVIASASGLSIDTIKELD